MQRGSNNLVGCGCLIVFGLVFAGFGALFVLVFPNMMREEAARIERMKPVSAIALGDRAPGEDVLIEGRLSPQNRQVFRSFVAYVHERLDRDADGDQEWEEYNQETPALLVDLPDGRIQIAQGYHLRNLSEGRTVREGNDRYRGLEVGDTVVAMGMATQSRELPAIDAEFVAGGTQQAFVESQRTGAWVMTIVGGIFVVVGLVLALIGVVSGVRALL
jgi:hypothetical protein